MSSLGDIGGRDWHRLAKAVRYDPDALLHRIMQLPDEATVVHNRMKSEGLKHNVIDRLQARICANAEKCLEIINKPTPHGD